LTQTNPDTPTFDGLAAGYGQFRPDYPGDILQAIADSARLVEATAPLALDVGAGTGISTRALAKALGERWRVIGLEPSADMREAASGEAHNGAVIDYREGTSQRLPVANAKAGLILVAQALHWFDRPTF
jgi:ubiquinone/menaquinone biosynthesis C-methylase UbiE